MARIPTDQIPARLEGTGWQPQGDGIVRDWKFDDFKAAMAFANRVADLAEEANHHPDIMVHGWNQVRLQLTTHSEGGVTDADLEMARRIDDLGED